MGYDSVNDYYDIYFKNIRLERLKEYSNFKFVKGHLEDKSLLESVYLEFEPSHVINLAAQAGVRYSIENPMAYIKSNIIGFQNIIELVRQTNPQNFLYASSSSVYGGNTEYPFSESQRVENPVSLYAATKLSNELVAKSYGNLYKIPNTGMRFFTVYGTFGRPDMAIFIFSKKMKEGQRLPVFNNGLMFRDFTYIEDIVSGILKALEKPDINQVYNFGRGRTEKLMDMITILSDAYGVKPALDLLPMQKGDVPQTSADISKAQKNLAYQPKVNLSEGLPFLQTGLNLYCSTCF